MARPYGYPSDFRDDYPPMDRPPGLLPPKYPSGTVCGFLSDHPQAVEIIPELEWDGLLVDEDEDDAPLEPWVHIKDQDGAGSCATESTTQAEEVVEQFQGNGLVELNPWFVYYHTREGHDGGSSHDENLAFMRANGIAPTSVWPRSQGFNRKPSDAAYEAAKAHRGKEFLEVRTWEELGSCLIARRPVILGWPGHSILAVRMRKNKRIKIANSWGADWGANGFGDMDRSNLVWGYGLYVVLTSTRNPS